MIQKGRGDEKYPNQKLITKLCI